MVAIKLVFGFWLVAENAGCGPHHASMRLVKFRSDIHSTISRVVGIGVVGWMQLRN